MIKYYLTHYLRVGWRGLRYILQAVICGLYMACILLLTSRCVETIT